MSLYLALMYICNSVPDWAIYILHGQYLALIHSHLKLQFFDWASVYVPALSLEWPSESNQTMGIVSRKSKMGVVSLSFSTCQRVCHLPEPARRLSAQLPLSFNKTQYFGSNRSQNTRGNKQPSSQQVWEYYESWCGLGVFWILEWS